MIGLSTILRKVIGHCFLALALASPLCAHVDNGVIAQSFGGAYRAVALGNDIIFSNPAGLLKNRRIAVEVDYLSGHDRSHVINGSIVDSKTTDWGLGLAYNASKKGSEIFLHQAYLTLAMPLISQMFALGASVNYRYDKNEASSPYRHFFNVDVGVMAMLPYGLNFAFVLDHIVKAKGREKGLGLAIGAAFDMASIVETVPLTLSFDWLMDDVKSKNSLDHRIGAGAQFVLFNVLPLRIGFQSNIKSSSHMASMGAGAIIKNFSIDGLYQQNLTVGKLRNFGFALRLNF